jgi:hypothetical protein
MNILSKAMSNKEEECLVLTRPKEDYNKRLGEVKGNFIYSIGDNELVIYMNEETLHTNTYVMIMLFHDESKRSKVIDIIGDRTTLTFDTSSVSNRVKLTGCKKSFQTMMREKGCYPDDISYRELENIVDAETDYYAFTNIDTLETEIQKDIILH